jgi:hypothetical protein
MSASPGRSAGRDPDNDAPLAMNNRKGDVGRHWQGRAPLRASDIRNAPAARQ